MVLLLRKLNLYFTKDTEAVHFFPEGGGVQLFPYLLFSRGVSGPLSAFGSAHGQFRHNGTIFITVLLLTIIVRH